MTIIPNCNIQHGGFFKDLKTDIAASVKELDEPGDVEPAKTRKMRKPGKDAKKYMDALATKECAESVKNLSLALITMNPPTIKHLDGAIELKNEAKDSDVNYFFIGDNGEEISISPDDYDETKTPVTTEELLDEYLEASSIKPKIKEEPAPVPKEMALEDFLEETKGGKFDILPVLYNLNYYVNGAFMPENIDKILITNPKRGDQIILYTKDNKRAFIDFVTGRRIVQTPDKNGKLQTRLLDDDGYKLKEDLNIIYAREKKFWA